MVLRPSRVIAGILAAIAIAVLVLGPTLSALGATAPAPGAVAATPCTWQSDLDNGGYFPCPELVSVAAGDVVRANGAARVTVTSIIDDHAGENNDDHVPALEVKVIGGGPNGTKVWASTVAYSRGEPVPDPHGRGRIWKVTLDLPGATPLGPLTALVTMVPFSDESFGSTITTRGDGFHLRVLSTMTLTAQAKAPIGSKVVLRGVLRVGAKFARAGLPVSVLVKPAHGQWRFLRTVQSGPHGAISTRVTLARSATYRFRYKQTTTRMGSEAGAYIRGLR